jgi:hypothetical protein
MKNLSIMLLGLTGALGAINPPPKPCAARTVPQAVVAKPAPVVVTSKNVAGIKWPEARVTGRPVAIKA